MTAITLEDNYDDVLGKAVRGLKLTPEAVAIQAGLDLPVVTRVLSGEFDEHAVRSLALVLSLAADPLVALGRHAYKPDVTPPAGLVGFNTPYADFFVNAFLIWDVDTKQAVVFDTGSDGQAILAEADARGLAIELVLVTHTHHDHIMCLDALTAETGAPAFVSPLEPTAGAEPYGAGQTFQVGRLTIEPRRTSGHSTGGTSYVVTGLATPVVVVGDALFAGSMGGGMVSYTDALTNNRAQIFTLPDETVICPGHGPLTTVGAEKRHNPFYPEFAQA
ncbi:MAG: MBL fold metallo-hydrolase [Candidatus Sericytochromatia bacterium]|nr:MBL fold metallo-hydrolase [Candidatus Sericytochromatia bacterium]